MDPAALTALVAALMGHPGAGPGTPAREAAAGWAFVVREEVREEYAEALRRWRAGQPRPEPIPADVVAAVIQKESSFRPGVRGAAGELSLMQVKPDGRATSVCPDLLGRLAEPRANVLCGVRLLRAARRSCGPDPRDYLGRYNGTQACGETAYARRVLGLLAAARAARSRTRFHARPRATIIALDG